ncbi:FAD-dependent oxidoreductase [Christensenella minuta]|uniref:FAD-dependent oxidoreductase n=1 Tax=Christensenella minuta TaxID=626937 RepID=UPI0021570ABD|nr:FAD-dependent oxidoreductase [Christensenella minuta]
MDKKVLIVGGVAGGASAAARLRRLDENAEIVLFERGEYISFANCGLPYYIGGEIKDKAALTLQTPQSFKARFNVDVRIQSEVVAIDRENKNVTVKHTDTGETYRESYDELILSMGAEPIRPPVPGMDSPKVFTLRNIPDTYRIKDYIKDYQPRSAVIVGGGFIGVEMAENLLQVGLEVTMVELADQILAPLDRDMACEVHRHVRSKGVKLMLENAVTAVSETANGLQITFSDGEVFADMLILAIGVKPESSIASEAGVQTNERGGILVNESMRTSEPHIYAVGDAVEVVNFVTGQKTMVPLAGPANKQGRIAADNICGIKSTFTGTQGSAILKAFDLTVATTGINEKTAKSQNLDYEKSFTYSASHATYYPGAVNMSIKTIFDKKTGKILGAQVVGYDGADKRCDVLATAIRFGATAADLTKLELCYAPPFSSAKDPVNMAGYVAENILAGKVKIFHWHDVKEIQQDDNAILLDVRTEMEYENGSISGFKNIPLDELRSRLSELDKAKKIYVTCQIGLRGYLACRILSQNGFDCYNLSGGYRLYQTIFGTAPLLPPKAKIDPETQRPEATSKGKTINIDACGLQCPGPIVKLGEALKDANVGDTIEITTTDPAFASDIEGFCRRTGHVFGGMVNSRGISTANITKTDTDDSPKACQTGNGKNFIVFSGDLDKAIASFIMANAAAAMGRKVSMFFTFWGLNILRKPEKISVKKDRLSKMFASMMPRGSKKLGLSKMNMGGMGAKMIRKVMNNKNISSLEELIHTAQQNGVELIACAMSMDVMGITQQELIDGVKTSGAAAMLAFAEESDMSLFI